MSVIHAPRKIDLDARSVGYIVVLGIWFVVLLLRFWYLQVVKAEELQEKAVQFRTTDVKKLAPRGLIYDRYGKLIAGVKPQIVLMAQPAVVTRQPWVLDKVCALIDVPKKKLENKIKDNLFRPYIPAPIYVGVPIDVATKISEAGDFLPGISVEWIPMRYYSDTLNFCHILGYVWTPSERDVLRLEEQQLEPADYVGKNGIEYKYEAELMGIPGLEKIEVDNKRRPQKVVERVSATPGKQLVLALDAQIQDFATKALKGRRGAVVALDPSTGEVLCLVSAPAFDAKVFEGGISTEDWNRLRDDPETPLMNRALQAQYSPGSTYKIVNAIAAALEGKFDPNHRAFCDGYYQVGNRKTKCLGRHGAVAFEYAFAKSCNVYFADEAMRTGIDGLRAGSKKAGLGAKTQIDLPSEMPGLVPTQEWLDSFKTPQKWYPGDTVNMSIGQGALATTPLQMATVAALVANNGIAYQPHIVKEIVDVDSIDNGVTSSKPVKPQILVNVGLPTEFWSRLKSAMQQVIEAGTGAGLKPIPGVRWGGKTGSTEHRNASKTHSWFVGIAPIEQPKIAIAVLVESAGHGSTIAAPIARDVIEKYLQRQKSTPLRPTN